MLRDVVDDQSTNWASVVWPSDGFEGFLTSLSYDEYEYGIPALKFDVLILHRQRLAPKLHADSSVMVQFKFSVQKL